MRLHDIMNAPSNLQPEMNRNRDRYRPIRKIHRGETVHPLPYPDNCPAIRYLADGKIQNIDGFIARNRVSGLLIIKNGEICLERYELGNEPSSKLNSFSVGKSVMSTLIGAAIHQGFIGNVEEPIMAYLPQLTGSGYDGCTIRNLLEMSSGVQWEEEYRNQTSSFARMFDAAEAKRKGGIMEVMASLPREVAPGSRFLYNSGESHVLSELITAATGQQLADYLSERIWSRFGMEADGYWTLESDSGQEVGGGGVNVTLRDYGRFALFFLNGGWANGEQILPPNWTTEASHPRIDSPQITYGRPTPGSPLGYGYHWWSFPKDPDARHLQAHSGAFIGQGIFGRFLYINPREQLVAAVWSEWPDPWLIEREFETYSFLAAAIDALRT